eukprot:3933925-Rhodomonas_salina.2
MQAVQERNDVALLVTWDIQWRSEAVIGPPGEIQAAFVAIASKSENGVGANVRNREVRRKPYQIRQREREGISEGRAVAFTQLA